MAQRTNSLSNIKNVKKENKSGEKMRLEGRRGGGRERERHIERKRPTDKNKEKNLILEGRK